MEGIIPISFYEAIAGTKAKGKKFKFLINIDANFLSIYQQI